VPTLTKLKQEHKLTDDRDLETLQPWMMFCIAIKEMHGLSWSEALKKLGKKGSRSQCSRMSHIANSPGGKTYRENVRELMNDPVALLEITMKANLFNIGADHVIAFEWAKDAHDYNAVDKMARYFEKLGGIKEDKKPVETPQVLHIHLEGAQLDSLPIKTSFEVIEAEVEEEGD